MTTTATKTQTETELKPMKRVSFDEEQLDDPRARLFAHMHLLWDRRKAILRATAIGALASALIAVLIPSRYSSTTQLMPPDPQSASGMAMMAAIASKASGGLSGIAGDLLGLKTSGALFIGVLRSQTAQENLVQQFDLRKAYGKRLVVDARTSLDQNTAISEDRKSGIITISVTDRSPQRAAAIASAYVDQLNVLIAGLSTSSAHRERVFLEERLKVAKQDLDEAASQLAQFSSKNNTLDIQTEGKAMLDAAATIGGQLIAAQSQLEGLRQIYTDNSPRVRSLNARVQELRKQLSKLGGYNEAAAPAAAGALESRPTDMPYPSIRQLPLLGAKYADYYRRAKIQETVFELLTSQYELAKVQEAKETPSVKVLDPAKVPERKSFPPRTLIVLLGTFLVAVVSVTWVVGFAHWEEVDPQDPGKLFLEHVAVSLRNDAAKFARRNGHGGNGVGQQTQQVWDKSSHERSLDDDQRQ